MCPVAGEGSNSLVTVSFSLVMAITRGGRDARTQHHNLTAQKVPSLSSSGEVVAGDCLYRLLEVGRESKSKGIR